MGLVLLPKRQQCTSKARMSSCPTSVICSWHETQPVYSCDFQPLPISQIKRILNLPHSTPASTPINASLAVPPSPNPSHHDPTHTAASSASTSRLPSEAPGEHGVAEGSTSTWKGKDAEHSAPVVRQYRLATAGADRHVRVSRENAVQTMCFHHNLITSALVSDLDDLPKCHVIDNNFRSPRARSYSTPPASRLPCNIEATYRTCECSEVES